MISADSTPAARQGAAPAETPRLRFASQSNAPAVLADIYRENVNIAVWQRQLPDELRSAAAQFSASNPTFASSMTVSPDSAFTSVSDALGTDDQGQLSESIAELVEMFCDLLGVERAGLRFGVLDSAMCPRFHVDRVPCRLVTTYGGPGTEWLQHQSVDRSKLGMGSRGKSDLESGLFKSPDEIEQLNCGDVALLKGELWEGNEDAGLVHRSPAVANGDLRLLLSLDVSS